MLSPEVLYEHWNSRFDEECTHDYTKGYPKKKGRSTVLGAFVRKFKDSSEELWLWYVPSSGSGHAIEGRIVYEDDEGFIWRRKSHQNGVPDLFLAFRAINVERFKKLYGYIPEGVKTTEELYEFFRKEALKKDSYGDNGYRTYLMCAKNSPETIVIPNLSARKPKHL